MSDERTWTWYVGCIAGLGDVIFQADNNHLYEIGYCKARYMCRVIIGPQGTKLMRIPFGCDKGAEAGLLRDKLLYFAPASQDAIDGAMECYGMKAIIAASAGDLGKAPKLTLVK
jgi:hypothetical protein